MRKDYLNVAGVLLTGVSSHAFEASELFAIQKGPMLLKPQFESSIVYTDNINYLGENKLSDFSAVISPGFKLQFGAKEDNYIEFSYFYDRIQYFQEHDFDANQHRVALNAHIEKSRFLLEAKDSVEYLASPLGGGITTLEGQLVERLAIVNNYRFTYDLSQRTGVYLGLVHMGNDYQNDIDLYDTRSLIGTLGFLYKAFSRSLFFGELYYGQTDNDPNIPTLEEYPRARYAGAFVGVRGNFTEKLSGTVKGGYEIRDYVDGIEGTEAPVMEASLTRAFSETTSATLVYSRRQNESVQYVRTTYVSDIISASLLQIIGGDKRLRAILNGGYYMYDYETSGGVTLYQNRSDDLIFLGLTLSYDVKLWMRILASYTFEHLTSNEPSVTEYTVNRVNLGLQFGF